ncbi:MAG TPA: hypothetical protein VFM93_11605 [Candidatus Limnocylindria bacterium]|nr:hypothetical protein [Candidatus Limnocylindria bacterium]
MIGSPEASFVTVVALALIATTAAIVRDVRARASLSREAAAQPG